MFTAANCRLQTYLGSKASMNDNDFLQTLGQHIEHCGRTGRAVQIEGGGSKHFYGGPLAGEIVSMQAFSRIL